MKRYRALKVSLFVLLSVFLLPGLLWAEPVVTLKPTKDYRDLVTQRQTVDLLIHEALAAFNAPARTPGAGFTGKLPTNMEIVADRLLTAADLEPYRADLLFSAASALIANGDVDGAIALYERILTLAPEDVDAHSYLAAWQRFKKNDAEFAKHMKFLETWAPDRADRLKDVFKTIDTVTALPIRDTLPPEEARNQKGPVAIVALGYALNPDGSMNPIMIQRLEKLLELAKQLPDALIVVTGGVPQNNRTEGHLMAGWLKDRGVDPSRIVEDNAARSTVENALFCSYVLAHHRIATAVIVSSGSHVRRAQTLFTIACRESGPMNIQFLSIGAPDKPLDELQKLSAGDLAGIYRDALKTMGLWSFRSYPLVER